MQQLLVDFFSFADPNIRYVVFGTLLLTGSTALIGSFALLKKKALIGDAIAHAVLPGICLAFIITGSKHPMVLTLGAFATGWLALILIDQITQHSKIKEDTAIALVLSSTFGLGVLLLTAVQHTGNAAQVGLANFLLGKAAALTSMDVQVMTILSLLSAVIVLLFFKEFTLVAFDKNFAYAIGIPVQRLELLLTSLTVLSIVVGIRAVGIVLIAAMLITPAATALFWTHHLPTMIGLAAALSMLAGLIGVFISYLAPAMPTGPWIVMIISLFAYTSFLFAPKKGLLARRLRQRKHQKKVLHENVLKLFYELGDLDGHFYKSRTLSALRQHRPLLQSKLLKGLHQLQQQNMLQQDNQKWRLTATGKNKGAAISRLHRLWELYLTQYLKIKPDHVHEDAESIEHIITPAVEADLQQLLKRHIQDP